MSQENTKSDSNIWSWRSDAKGCIISVSSAFSLALGIQASQNIIGLSFWKFATGLSHISTGWQDLEEAFIQHKKIKKFVFDYRAHGQIVRIVLAGKPIINRGQYIGHEGTGYITNEYEISIPEIAQNMLSTSMEKLHIGIAIFSKENGLIEFNEDFFNHMRIINVNISRSVTYDRVILSVKKQLVFSEDFSYTHHNESCLYFKQNTQSLLSIKKTTDQQGIITVKTEIHDNLMPTIHQFKQSISSFKKNHILLERRIDEYKNKLSSIFNGTSTKHHLKNELFDDEYKKFFSFFENTLDVGILITNIKGDIDSANYYAAQLFGYVTAETFIKNKNKTELSYFLAQRQERIQHSIETKLNRYEHIIEINNYIQKAQVKEIITFYPSVYNPQKVISFFYNMTENISDMSYHEDLQQLLINYMVNQVKSSINIINGYNALKENHNNSLISDKECATQIQKSCQNILTNLSDILNINKISPNLHKIEKSVFVVQQILSDCLKNFQTDISEKKLNLQMQSQENSLFVIADQELFFTALNKLFNMIIKSSKEGSYLFFDIIENIEKQHIQIQIFTNSIVDFYKLSEMNYSDIMHNFTTHSMSTLEYKISENIFKLLGCKCIIKQKENSIFEINIHISGDMITTQHQRNRDNFIV